MKLEKNDRDAAIHSLKRYADSEFPEPIGELGAILLLDFFLQEIGPLLYNKAIADAQTRIEQRVGDLNGELFEEPFTYWAKKEKRNR